MPSSSCDAGERALPEGLADDRGVLEDAALRARQRVEPGGEHGVDRLGERLDVLATPPRGSG